MRVPQRLDYALQALTLLSGRPAGTYLAAGDIARDLSLPKRFVEQQVTALAHANIVHCRRGATGGCALARASEEISVGEVVVALQGDVLDVPKQSESATAELWEQAAHNLTRFLDGVTLADLAARQAELDAASQPMYFI